MIPRILLPIAPLPIRGGTLRRLRLWSRAMAGRVEPVFLCHSPDPAAAARLREAGAQVRETRLLDRSARRLVLPGALAIRRAIREVRPAAIVSMFPMTDLFTGLANGRGRRWLGPALPHYVHVAGDPVWIYEPSLRRRALVRIVRTALDGATGAIAICRHDADLLVREYGADPAKVAVVPIGIDAEPAEKGAVHHPLALGIASRLDAAKHVDQVIEVVRDLVTARGRCLTLEIYGEGSERALLEDRVRALELDDVVRFHGWVTDPYAAFDSIDCLLLFSESEGTPRSILEAGIRGVPTIARSVGGVPEIVVDGETGYVVHTLEEFAARIADLLDEPDRALQLGRAATRFVLGRHTVAREVEGLLEVIGL